jgi:hypothetical protein
VQYQVIGWKNDVGIVNVSYLWLDQLIGIASQKCKTNYLSDILMLVVLFYIWLD